MLNVVLYKPEIPSNTGNIARTCAVTGARLHLIKPLGFSLEDKYLKRAGLDYWHLLDIKIHESWERFEEENILAGCFFFFTKKAEKIYSECDYNGENIFLVYGSETRGLDQEILEKHSDHKVKIPMINNPAARSLNLSNAVAVGVYEVLRRKNFLV